MADLSTIALALPDVEQGVACAGTALESRTFATGKKSFLFLSKTQARLKLGASAPEGKKLGFAVGANGWVTIPLDAVPPVSVLRRWIAESHRLMSPPAKKGPPTKAQSARKKSR